MDAKVTAVLTDEQGWQKPFELEEGIYWIGSSPKAHIRLPNGVNVAPFHLQLVNLYADAGLRIINLAHDPLIVNRGEESSLIAPNHSTDLTGPESLQVGSYQLSFRLGSLNHPSPTSRESRQEVIGLRLVLSDVVLRPGIPIEGELTLQNLGDHACQFTVTVEGLPEESVVVTPPPLIHSGGEETCQVRFFHRKMSPPAGHQLVTLRVSAPTTYPGIETYIQQMIRVTPWYEQMFTLGVPQGDETQEDNEPEATAEMPVSSNVMETAPVESSIPEETPRMDGFEEPGLIGAAETPLQETVGADGLTGVSVPEPIVEIRNQSDDSTSAADDLVSPTQPAQSQDTKPADAGVTVTPPLRAGKRPDLSAARVIQANSGDFLDKRTRSE